MTSHGICVFFLSLSLADELRCMTPSLSSFVHFSIFFTRTVAKFLKSALKTPKSPAEDSTSSVLKTPSRSTATTNNVNSMSKSMSLINQDSSLMVTSDYSGECLTTKSSMSTSLYNPVQENPTETSESIGTSVPSVVMRVGKIPLGTRVLPVLETNGDLPPVKLRHYQSEKKSSPSTEQPTMSDPLASPTNMDAAPKSNTEDHNEQYKRQ